MTPAARPPMARFDGEDFVGHEPRECGEHRTVGPHRAWCFRCGEWCSPSAPCVRCAITPRPWRDSADPTPEQLAGWLTRCTAEERVDLCARMLEARERMRQCDQMNHRGLLAEVEGLRQMLAESLDTAERAAIVAWLRAAAREGGDAADEMEPGSDARRSMTTTASTYATAADLIEEGAHHAADTPGDGR